MSNNREGLPFAVGLFIIWMVCIIYLALFAFIAVIIVLYVVEAVLWPIHISLKAMGLKGIYAPDAESEAKTITIRKAEPK